MVLIELELRNPSMSRKEYLSVETLRLGITTTFLLQYGRVTTAIAFSRQNGDFTIRRRDGNENVQNNNRFSRQNNNFARASHFFVHFFVVFCTTTTKNCLILLFLEDVNRPRRNFIPVFLNLNMVLRNSTPGGFAYI